MAALRTIYSSNPEAPNQQLVRLDGGLDKHDPDVPWGRVEGSGRIGWRCYPLAGNGAVVGEGLTRDGAVFSAMDRLDRARREGRIPDPAPRADAGGED